jgi:DNA polymerase III epsilon subunit-like protein
MATSMIHWNGNQVCAIDTETTGLDDMFHEIIEIAIIPLDSNFKPRQDVMPFQLDLAPDFPTRYDKEAIKIHGKNLAEIILRGIDHEKAKDLLTDWVKKLSLPVTKYGRLKQIIPLGHNYAFDRGFINHWLGESLYGEIFHYHYRDSMLAAQFLNDHAAMHAEKVPYPKVSLSYLANLLNVRHDQQHTALQDAQVCAECYRLMLQQGILA